jgi:O-6-methylguanine DNA methyltransferase
MAWRLVPRTRRGHYPAGMPGPAAIFTAVAGPWGPIHVAASADGLVAIELLTPTDAFVAALERRLHGAVIPPDARPQTDAGTRRRQRHLDDGERRVRRYLEGDPEAFAGSVVDLAGRPAWDVAVLAAVREIPWGRTASYGSIAGAVGRPGAGRAVGGAVGRNPISLAIPCHRVIAGDGTLGGYGGSWWGSRELRLAVKRELLGREGVVVPDRLAVPDRVAGAIAAR